MTVKKATTNGKKKAEPKKPIGRPCTVCTHKKFAEINSAISSGKKSLRSIALQYKLIHTSVNRHTEKCLGLEIGTLIQEQKTTQAIDVMAEFQNLFQAALKGLKAATDALTVDGEINFNPRAWEIDVVYEDSNDCDQHGTPKTKKTTLEALIALAEENGVFSMQHTFVKVQDLRKTYLDAIKATESLVDRFAKIGGLYQQDRQNEADLKRIVEAIIETRRRHPEISAEEAVQMFAKGRGVPVEKVLEHLEAVN